jgi:hypothetical protein
MIKNYTSSVPANRSVLHIEDCLAAHGAQSVIKQYDENKNLSSVSFFMQIKGKLIPFRLPARIDQVEKVLRSNVKRPRRGTLDKIKEQALRTAWKIISDWVDSQMALVELQQAELAEIFMPYMWSERLGQSFYQIAVEKGFNLLEAPKK